ncbi:MAG: gliding motility-associated ABC transporter substrate-binding protein GldG [Cyclobacteriaceae bacterium]
MKSKKTGDLLLLANGIALVVVLNMLASLYFFRIDLTEEQRYTIKEPTRQLLSELTDDVFIEVYLEGDLNAGFQRLQRSVRELLEEFRITSNNRIQFTFTNPEMALGKQAQSEFMQDLAERGVSPLSVIDTKGGERIEKIIFPGAIIEADGFETSVMLLKGDRTRGADQVLNQSIEGLEYEFASAIYKLTNTNRKKIGLLTGHGELDSLEIASLNNALLDQYEVRKVDITRRETIEGYDAIIVAKPRFTFSERDKFKLDQYVMRGGKLLLMIDKMDAAMDSASREDYFAFPYNLNLDDLLFRYGVRINPDLIQDRVAARYPIVTGQIGGQPQIVQMDWPFFPLVNSYADHSITRNLDASFLKFASSIDTVKAVGVRKQLLASTSPASRAIGTPVNVSANSLRSLDPALLSQGPIPVAYLLEGRFSSLYKNRFVPEGIAAEKVVEESEDTKIIVVSDGDLARNNVNGRTGQPQQLGLDPISNYTFANEGLILNMLAYLTEEEGLIIARNKEVKIRPLDKEKVSAERTFWQLLNIVLPLVLLAGIGLVKNQLRKRRYTKF